MKWFLAIGLFFAVNVCQAQLELNLQQCREMAMESSKKMAIAGQKKAKVTFDKKAYRANFFPKVSGIGMYAYMQKDFSFSIKGGYLPTYIQGNNGQWIPNLLLNPETGQPVVGSDGKYIFNQYAYMPDIALSLGLDHAYTVGGILEQPVYMGGKVRAAYRMASVGVEMAELNLKYNRAEVLAETDQAYWQYVRLQETVLSALKYKEAVEELLRNLSDACRTGMALQNDVLKARVKLNEAELMLQKARNGQTLSRMNLCRLIGVGLHTAIQVNDTLGETILPDLWEGEQDISKRPEYGLLDKEVELKERQMEVTRSDFLPRLGVSVSYGYTDGIAVGGESEGMASFMALASLKVPVFHWSEGRNKIKALKAEREISELTREDAVQMMQLEVAKARFGVEDALTRVKLTRKSLQQAEENLTVSRNRYEVGMETLTNYMEAQAQWQKAWNDWIDAKAELKLSETRYLKATGRLGE